MRALLLERVRWAVSQKATDQEARSTFDPAFGHVNCASLLGTNMSRTVSPILQYGEYKKMKLPESSPISNIIGATTDREPWRVIQRLATSEQSVSTMTCVKPLRHAKITPSRTAIASAMKGSVTPGYGLLHAPRNEQEDRATPPAPPLPSSRLIAASVLMVMKPSSGGRHPCPGMISASCRGTSRRDNASRVRRTELAGSS